MDLDPNDKVEFILNMASKVIPSFFMHCLISKRIIKKQLLNEKIRFYIFFDSHFCHELRTLRICNYTSLTCHKKVISRASKHENEKKM